MSNSAVMETAQAGIEAAYARGYKAGAARQREAWANWFDSLPTGLKDAIQRKRRGAVIENTWHKNGSLTLKVPAAPHE